MIKLINSISAVEVPIDAFNIGIKLDTLSYDVKGQQTINIDLKTSYTILGEVTLKNVDIKKPRNFTHDEFSHYSIYIRSLIKSNGAVITSANKFIILKSNK